MPKDKYVFSHRIGLSVTALLPRYAIKMRDIHATVRVESKKEEVNAAGVNKRITRKTYKNQICIQEI